MTTAPQYTGELTKGTEPNTVVGEIRDQFGWPIILTGVLDPATRAYVLTGTLGPTPAALHIATIDGPRAEPAGDARSCTCHPDDAPVPCPRRYALSECQAAMPEAAE
jgi:hypothetical protein